MKRPPKPVPAPVDEAAAVPFRGTPASNRTLLSLQALLIATAVFWIYGSSLHGGWLWDDNLYLTENPLLHDPVRWWKIWFLPGSQIEYYPVAQSVQWLQWQLWGDDTLGYHLTNVVLHLLGSLLVWRLLSKFGLRSAWLGGLIFAIHPMQVESVAWISELKNTLSLPPLLLAMCAFIDYEENKKIAFYGRSLGFFIVAMLCKNSMALFPVVILLYAWWKRGRIGRNDLRACAPFLAVSVVLVATTVWAGSRFAHVHSPSPDSASPPMAGFFSQLALAGWVVSFYFSKCFWPVGLLPIYPAWTLNPLSGAQILAWPLFGAVLGWLWRKRRGWGRHALLGLGFFLINLVPVFGLIAVRSATVVWSLDHLAYVPLIGLIGLIVAALGRIYGQIPPFARPAGIAAVTAAMALLLFSSRGYAGAFVNPEQLWTYTLRHDPGSWQAHRNLGDVLTEKGRIDEALAQYGRALRINPDSMEVHDRIGEALLKGGRDAEAIREFEQVLSFNPDYVRTHYELGEALRRAGRIPDAMEQYRRALRIFPGYAAAHHKLGDCLMRTGRVSEATDEYEETLQIDPGDFEAHNNLGGVLFKAGRFDEAMEHFAASLKINPDNATTHNNMGISLAKTGRISEAIGQFEAALRIKPDFTAARNNLAQMRAIYKDSPAPN